MTSGAPETAEGLGPRAVVRPRGRILIVDDEANARAALSEILRDEGYATETAADGFKALGKLEEFAPDVVLTDLKMPGADGLTVIREARRLKADIPIIIITGFSSEASAIEAANLGVAGYLTKPFRVPRVLAVAARALGE